MTESDQKSGEPTESKKDSEFCENSHTKRNQRSCKTKLKSIKRIKKHENINRGGFKDKEANGKYSRKKARLKSKTWKSKTRKTLGGRVQYTDTAENENSALSKTLSGTR